MLRVLELFAGIGACSKALERLDIEHEVVDAVEIDKYAIKSFNAVHGTDFEPQDITKWDKNIDVDLIMHGSPCQDFSVAGKGKGGDKGSGTRSSLMYETLRIVEKLEPKYVIWENVKNLLSKKHIHNWEAYCNKMNELGYNNWCKVMNSKNYGVPQNRERVFTVSIRKDVYDKEFVFPEATELSTNLKDIISDKVDTKYYIDNSKIRSNELLSKLKTGVKQCKKTYTKSVRVGGIYDSAVSKHQAGGVYDPNGISATLDTMRGGNREPIILSGAHSIRKLTPRECWKLMGFNDDDFDKAEKVNSNSQLYKQAGNSIVVNVLEAILRSLYGETTSI